MTFTHFKSAEYGLIAIKDIGPEALRIIATDIRRNGGDWALAAHMDEVAMDKERAWHDNFPHDYAEWAAMNPIRHEEFQATHFPGKVF